MSHAESDDPSDDRIVATIVRYDDEPDECTLHHPDPPEGQRTTMWMSAKEGSYVDTVAWR